MKQFVILILCIQFVTNLCLAQNVGINVANPTNQFQIGVTPGFVGNDLSIGNGTQAMSITQAASSSIWYSNTAFSLMPNGNPYINTGYLGIGTVTPLFPITLKTPSGSSSWGLLHTDGAVELGDYIIANTAGEIGTRTAHPFYIFANNSDANPAINVGIDSKVGIVSGGTPVNYFQVGGMGSTGYNNFHIAFGNGSQVSGFTILGNGNTLWQTTSNISLMPKGNGNGYVGIDVQSPANALQIGSVGSTGYSNNHIAFGNGSQASGITQTSSVAQWLSTTDIVLMPKGNGHGRVGINTYSPEAPLEVDDYVTFPTSEYAYYYLGVTGIPVTVNHVEAHGNIAPQISIEAYANIVASEFDARSDARIKDIVGVSNTANDLKTLNKLIITDYFLKDKMASGNKQFKKVIAQQVESVYPQVVSKHLDFIPNVYQIADKITKDEKGVLLHFNNGHHLSNDAKRLKLLSSNSNTMNKYEIISVVSADDVLINAPELEADKVFVYGEEVNDFRTVDYEGLTTLNVSATQELNKLFQAQQAEINELKEEIKKLKTISNTP